MITLSNGNKTAKLEDFGFIASPNFKVPSSGSYDRKLQYIPGRFSPWDFGVQQKGKKMDVHCKSICKTQAELENNINKFNAFVLDDDKSPKTMKMSYDYEPDKFYYVQLDGPFDPDRSTVLKDLTIPFFAGDSNKYADSSIYDRKVIYGQVEKGDYYPNTQSFQWIYPRHYSGVFNYSAFTTDIKITISGTVKNASIKHYESGKELSFPDILKGTIILDSSNKTVTVNGVTILEGSNYNFFELANGKNGFCFEGETPNAKITFDWLHRF